MLDQKTLNETLETLRKIKDKTDAAIDKLHTKLDEIEDLHDTVACTDEDMNTCYCSEPAYHAAELRAALRADDPEHLRSAVEIAAAYLTTLAELEHQSVKGPHPGQEIKLADLDSLPQGAVIADNTGDLWVRETTGWRCYERLGSIDLEEDFQPFIYQAQI